jgi:hypothetical protein
MTTIKQYKNRLGVYEPYQSGGGKDKYKTENNEHYYSTPHYMSFMDAMYVNKYGKINQEGGGSVNGDLDVPTSLHHYFRTLRKWSDRLSQSGVQNGGMIVNDVEAHRMTEKALNTKINVYSANKVGGRNRLLIEGGRRRGGVRNINNNQLEAFSLIVKGDNEFKPVLYSKLEIT